MALRGHNQLRAGVKALEQDEDAQRLLGFSDGLPHYDTFRELFHERHDEGGKAQGQRLGHPPDEDPEQCAQRNLGHNGGLACGKGGLGGALGRGEQDREDEKRRAKGKRDLPPPVESEAALALGGWFGQERRAMRLHGASLEGRWR